MKGTRPETAATCDELAGERRIKKKQFHMLPLWNRAELHRLPMPNRYYWQPTRYWRT